MRFPSDRGSRPGKAAAVGSVAVLLGIGTLVTSPDSPSAQDPGWHMVAVDGPSVGPVDGLAAFGLVMAAGGSGARNVVRERRPREISLSDLVSSLSERNLDILIAGATRAGAGATRDQAEASHDPIFGASWSFSESTSFHRGDYVVRDRSPRADVVGGTDETTNEQDAACVVVDGQTVNNGDTGQCFSAAVKGLEFETASWATRPSSLPHSWTGSLGLTQPFAWGPVASASYSSTFSKLNSYSTPMFTTALANADPFGWGNRMPWTSSATVSLSTPLPFAKGFGPDGSSTNLAIASARIGDRRAMLQQAAIVNARRTTVETAYWDLVAAFEALRVNARHRDYLEDRLAQARRRLAAGLITAYDHDQIETELLNHRNQEEVAWNIYLARSNALLEMLDAEYDTVLVPSGFEHDLEAKATVDPNVALDVALENNPDIKISHEDLAATRAAVRYRENQSLPDISLDMSYSMSQSSSTFGYGSWWDSATHVLSPDSDEFYVGVRLSFPLWEQASESALARARITRKQADDRIQLTRNLVVQRVNAAVNESLSAETLVRQTGADVTLASLALEKSRVLHEADMLTEFEVLGKYNDLLRARLAEVNAKITRRKALAELLGAQGLMVTRVDRGDGDGGE